MPSPALSLKKKTAIVVVIGDEILSGYTLDTNSHYLSQVLRDCGVICLSRHTVRDDKEEIKRILKISLDEKPDYLFLCGGLGPTHDDVTFESVAEALQRRLVLSRAVVEHIQKKLDAINRLLPEEKWLREKMARIPEGTEVLCNKAGTAPALRFCVGQTQLFLLPGVPHELQWLIENEIKANYLEEGCRKDYVVELTVKRGESSFASLLKRIQKKHPHVKIGSYPQKGKVMLRISGE
ncbi:MAG TPA: competence/damage-inducible protein A, partial [Thermoplasmata archaeon]|nr:competence/damage-inducible protein A [Thermoplasmata archaeon]